MRKQFNLYIVSFLTLAALLLGAFGASFVAAKGQGQVAGRHTSQATPTTSVKNAPVHLLGMHAVNMQNVPVDTAGRTLSHRPQPMPFLTVRSASKYAQLKAAAAHARAAVAGTHPYANPRNGTFTPVARSNFQGLSDSAATCPYFGGCQPPDQALATSSNWVLQGVNTSFAVYNTRGVIQAGWPKNAQTFFGVPNPPNNCDPHGPFLSDPRAFYDPNGGHFWVAMLQVEGAIGLNNCPEQTLYWVAVSQTNNPNGAWNVYSFDMSLGTTNVADYTQFGFDAQAIYFSGNMFTQNGSAFAYAEVFGINKAQMEAGASSPTGSAFFDFTVNSVVVDTVQPVETEAHKNSGPRSGVFINSFNGNGDPFGNDCFTSACSGVTVWSMSKPGTSSSSMIGVFISTDSYVIAPYADQPGCPQCLETLDTRISGTPVYHDGAISFALETGVANSSRVVPGIYWAQVNPVLNDDGSMSGGTLFQAGYYYYRGDGAAYFGTLMPDNDGNLFMVFEYSSSAINPSVAYTARRVTFAPGQFHDGGWYLKAGQAPTFNFRWGDFEATSYDGFTNDDVWFAGEYSAFNGDWSTFIGKDRFSLSTP